MMILEGDAEAKAEKIIALLHDEQKRDDMARIGKLSKPRWGGVSRIAQLIANDLK